MGGNAFKHLDLVRVKYEDVFDTVKYVVDLLQFPDFTYDYAVSHMMGSAGKQADSGDLDFAMNNRTPRFYGETDEPVFNLKALAARVREVLPEGHVSTKTLKGGQFQTAFPVAGDVSKGLVQVDFVAGNTEWLMFSHFSPGKFTSPYKGVLMSTMLGVLAKMRKEFEVFDGDRRVARVGLAYDLEKGLTRLWEYQKRPGQGATTVSADEFETHVPGPRFPRLGYVTNPEAVLEMLFGQKVLQSDVDTFEKLVKKVKETMPDRFLEAKERFLVASTRSSAANNTDLVSLANDSVWEV